MGAQFGKRPCDGFVPQAEPQISQIAQMKKRVGQATGEANVRDFLSWICVIGVDLRTFASSHRYQHQDANAAGHAPRPNQGICVIGVICG